MHLLFLAAGALLLAVLLLTYLTSLSHGQLRTAMALQEGVSYRAETVSSVPRTA